MPTILFFHSVFGQGQQDYGSYHQQVFVAEKLINQERFADALRFYDTLIDTHNFVFLRDYKVATQLALKLNQMDKARNFLRQGVLGGWTMKQIRKNKFLDPLRRDQGFKAIKKDYSQLRAEYKAGLNASLRKRVKKMASRDQWKAFGALFTFSAKAQDRYAERKFAPHSERQMAELDEILKSHGYPGEQLIGNDTWMTTILSHHNSISREYAERDTLYPAIKPRLAEALSNGQISPFELALIDDWYHKVKSGWSGSEGYGILDRPGVQTLPKFNELREHVCLRPIEVRNQLVEIQTKTGMDFYLPGG
ncbi:MAG: hypothetical protein ABF295_03915, partial [Flavobacteriaceae bacterium]